MVARISPSPTVRIERERIASRRSCRDEPDETRPALQLLADPAVTDGGGHNRHLDDDQRRSQKQEGGRPVVGPHHPEPIAFQVVHLASVASELVVVGDPRGGHLDALEPHETQSPAKVDILQVEEVLVPEPAEVVEQPAVDDEGGPGRKRHFDLGDIGRDRLATVGRPGKPEVGEGAAGGEPVIGGIGEVHDRHGGAHLGTADGLNERRQPARRRLGVGVEEGDHLTTGEGGAEIAAVGEPVVLVEGHEFDPHPFHDTDGAVGRSIVDDDDLFRPLGVAQQDPERRLDVGCGIVGDEDEGNRVSTGVPHPGHRSQWVSPKNSMMWLDAVMTKSSRR